jgi:hypothetical protein
MPLRYRRDVDAAGEDTIVFIGVGASLDDLTGRSRPQKRQMTASGCISSAQKGHLTLLSISFIGNHLQIPCAASLSAEISIEIQLYLIEDEPDFTSQLM